MIHTQEIQWEWVNVYQLSVLNGDLVEADFFWCYTKVDYTVQSISRSLLSLWQLYSTFFFVDMWSEDIVAMEL